MNVFRAGLIERVDVPTCPSDARPMLRPDGNPRKCLPHQNNLCINALPDKTNATTVCCWYNEVDYFCCLDVRPEECPDYRDVTVVVHHAYPQNPYALRSFHFREGIEDEIAAAAEEAADLKKFRAEGGIVVRQNVTELVDGDATQQRFLLKFDEM
ncbi:unnamed protein product [Enterobius vermicularis]|uniref:YkgJ family cysteine cluster protein n=1 Tax=Enterobius vermicularis TaxID=51028 RepID=A0A0N4UUT8_ENTVE|nr:unnamed protein product [Enterobius vermicularis]